MWCTSRVFHPFKISDLGEMMSIMTKITAKGTREVGFDGIFISPLTPIVISPLGVLIPLVLVAPSRLVLLGLIPAIAIGYGC